MRASGDAQADNTMSTASQKKLKRDFIGVIVLPTFLVSKTFYNIRGLPPNGVRSRSMALGPSVDST